MKIFSAFPQVHQGIVPDISPNWQNAIKVGSDHFSW
jgi:hypothetical protein